MGSTPTGGKCGGAYLNLFLAVEWKLEFDNLYLHDPFMALLKQYDVFMHKDF